MFYETPHFVVEAHPKPFVSRRDGGHIRIRIKDESVSDRTKLAPVEAVELMRLTILVGEAVEKAMNKRGVPVVKINYQEMGNWAFKTGGHNFLHVHVFGRSKDAVKQPYTEAVFLPGRSSGFYDGFEPLNTEDIAAITSEMETLNKEARFQDAQWHL